MLSNEMAMAVNEFITGAGGGWFVAAVLFVLFAIGGEREISLRKKVQHLERQRQARHSNQPCQMTHTDNTQ